MAVSARRWYIPPEQRVASLVYQSVVAKLTDLPIEEVGSPFPPTTFIAEETAMLNQRRVVILESQPDWRMRSDLITLFRGPSQGLSLSVYRTWSGL